MCTSLALPLPDGRQLFGRTLDWSEHFGERLVLSSCDFDLTPAVFGTHPALLGMATVVEGYPLYAEAMNEYGLCMAGLRFAAFAFYAPPTDPAVTDGVVRVGNMTEVAPWAFIPHILSTCRTVVEAKAALADLCLVDRPYVRRDGGTIPNSPMHWHIAGAEAAGGSVVVEATATGLHVYDAPMGAMTNAPDYPMQTDALCAYERGEATLPGDYSSSARFIRTAVLRRGTCDYWQSELGWTGESSDAPDGVPPMTRFFRILAAVAPPPGMGAPAAGVDVLSGKAADKTREDATVIHQRTLYTVCYDGHAGSCRVLWENGEESTMAFRG